MGCWITRSAAPSWGGQGAWSRLPASPRNRPRAATPVSIAPSLARPASRLQLVAQWIVAAVVIGFAARAVAKQWRDVAPALAELRFDWLRVLGSGALVLATYFIL